MDNFIFDDVPVASGNLIKEIGVRLMKKVILIVWGAFAITFVVFLSIWLFRVFFPFLEYADAFKTLNGTSVGEFFGVQWVLEQLFLVPSFILMVVFLAITLVFGLVLKIMNIRENRT